MDVHIESDNSQWMTSGKIQVIKPEASDYLCPCKQSYGESIGIGLSVCRHDLSMHVLRN